MESLVTYNRIVGNIFFGWTYKGENISKWRIWFYRLWNIFLVAIHVTMCYVSYRAIRHFNKRHHQKSPNHNPASVTKISLVNLIRLISIVGVNVNALLTSVYLLLLGHKILDILFNDDSIVINSKVKTKIVILIIIVVITTSTIGAIICTYSVWFNSPPITPFIFIIPMYLITSTQITILSFIAYKSFVVKHYLVENSNNNLDSIYQKVVKIDQSLRKFDRYVSTYVMLTLLFNQIYCMSSICQLAIDYKSTLVSSCVFMFVGLTSLLVLCFCCDIIPSSLSKLLNNHESTVISHTDRIILIQLRQLNDRIGFTAFGLFRVNANTFMSCLGLIITYSVIIIQTGGQ